VLAFFKTTCPTCQLAFPVYGELERRLRGTASVIAMAQDPADKARAWLDECGFEGPVFDDEATGYEISDEFEIRSVPTVFLVDAGGTIVDMVEGWDRDLTNQLARRIGELTGTELGDVSTPEDGLPPFKPG
jgi:thiol-disulfide isomerase/thioredoxin